MSGSWSCFCSLDTESEGCAHIQAVVKKYDILFIADEVICAFGRLGTMFGCDKYNIKPDMVSLVKALSSAYMPIGAVLVSPEVSDVIHSQSNKLGSFSHGFTYSGHPVSCTVAIEALKIYKNIVEKVKSIAPKFQDGLKAFSDSPIVGGRIRGTEWGVGAYFGAQCEKNGMLVRVAGDNIMMSPPFIMTPEEVDEQLDQNSFSVPEIINQDQALCTAWDGTTGRLDQDFL
ncbi:hypothetical protein K1719_028144 [Acacia pycnantha]|nr:hypothetical protein K1719_028144 [Acacia pycnantha]